MKKLAIDRWHKHFYTMYILNIILFFCFFVAMGLCVTFAYIVRQPVIYLNDKVFYRLYKFFEIYQNSKPVYMIFSPKKTLLKAKSYLP